MAELSETDRTDNAAASPISPDHVNERELLLISYNMHGYNQGQQTVRDLIFDRNPDAFMLQEHWLTPANLVKFENDFPAYNCFGSSAMADCVERGVLRGRPFGGVMVLVSKKLQHCTQLLCADERYVVVLVGNTMIIDVYLPCVGINDRVFVCEELLCNLIKWMQKFPAANVIIGGDLNTNLDANNTVSTLLNKFIFDNKLIRCDKLTAGYGQNPPTYVNEALNVHSSIDCFIASNESVVSNFSVLELACNLSDHNPITLCCKCKVVNGNIDDEVQESHPVMTVKQLRWDKADICLYKSITGYYFQRIFEELLHVEATIKESLTVDVQKCVNDIYEQVIQILAHAATHSVPEYKKIFF